MTAAQCTIDASAQYNMRIGSIRFDNGGMQQVANQIVSHPGYEPSTLRNDLALLRIPSPVQFTDAVRPVRLPAAGQLNRPYGGQRAIISGWGRLTQSGLHQEILRYADVSIITAAQCRMSFPVTVPERDIFDTTICALGATSNQSTCPGDWGGPLVIYENGVPTQYGISSWASSGLGCTFSLPSGYTRTSHYLSFIAQITGVPVRN